MHFLLERLAWSISDFYMDVNLLEFGVGPETQHFSQGSSDCLLLVYSPYFE